MNRSPSQSKVLVKWAVIFIGVAIVLIYSGLKFQKQVRGPQITISSPTRTTIHHSLIDIEGRADNIDRIKLNGRKIFINKKGEFHEQLLLHPGYNIMTIEAWDRFGDRTKKKIEMIYN